MAGEPGATYTVSIVNNGSASTNGTTVTVTDAIPSGMTLVSIQTGSSAEWSCTSNSCIIASALPAGRSYPQLTILVNVASNAPSSVTNQVSVSGGGSAPASSTDLTTIDPAPSQPPSLKVAMAHKGDFSVGQNLASVTVTVSNVGATATIGTVTVSPTWPAGESGIGQGTAWNCSLNSLPAGQCTRNDPLGPGDSYPPITFLVDIDANASSPLANSVQVTGGLSASTTTTDSVLVGGPNACASLPSGIESLMSGQYAAVAQGWLAVNGTPNVIAFSVALDGAGKIKDLGGGIGGELDLNNANTGPQNFAITSAGSFYTVGPELGEPQYGGPPAGYVGCMRLQTSGGPFTFVFELGGFISGVATTGAVLQINDESGTKSFVSGKLRIQDSTAFGTGDTTALHTNYAFGEHGGETNGRYALAGSFFLDPSSGTVSSFTADQNAAGISSSISGTGTVSSVSRMDGRAILSLTVQGSPGSANDSILYIVNANEILIVGADVFGSGTPLRSGEAIVSNSSNMATSMAGNQIIHITGQGICNVNGITAPCANAALGLLTLAAESSTSGTFTGTVFQYDVQNGRKTTSIASGNPGTFMLASSTGRVTVGNAGANLSVLYLASPASNTEPITFFILGADSLASFGYAEQGATATVSNSLLSGGYFVVNDDSGDISVWNQIGIFTSFTSGPFGSWDYTWDGQQLLNALTNEYNAPLNITNHDPNGNPAPGLGTAGVGVVAITNGKRILCLVEGGQFPKETGIGATSATILIAESQ